MKPDSGGAGGTNASGYVVGRNPRPQVAQMRNLHVYIVPVGSGARGECTAFYTRRADGPYYQWHYVESSGRWRYSRVSLDRPALRVLCVARWDAVPTALRDRLGEHYLE